MNIRDFDGSKSDLLELCDMFVSLAEFDNEVKMNYSQYIAELYKILNIKNSRCFILTNKDDIIGFVLMRPDGKGGVIGQSFFLKEDYRKSMFFSFTMDWLENWVENNYLYCDLILVNNTILDMYEKRNDERYCKKYSVYTFTPKGK